MSATCLSRDNDQANLTTEKDQANLTTENDQANLTGENELGRGKNNKKQQQLETLKQKNNQPATNPATNQQQ